MSTAGGSLTLLNSSVLFNITAVGTGLDGGGIQCRGEHQRHRAQQHVPGEHSRRRRRRHRHGRRQPADREQHVHRQRGRRHSRRRRRRSTSSARLALAGSPSATALSPATAPRPAAAGSTPRRPTRTFTIENSTITGNSSGSASATVGQGGGGISVTNATGVLNLRAPSWRARHRRPTAGRMWRRPHARAKCQLQLDRRRTPGSPRPARAATTRSARPGHRSTRCSAPSP